MQRLLCKLLQKFLKYFILDSSEYFSNSSTNGTFYFSTDSFEYFILNFFRSNTQNSSRDSFRDTVNNYFRNQFKIFFCVLSVFVYWDNVKVFHSTLSKFFSCDPATHIPQFYLKFCFWALWRSLFLDFWWKICKNFFRSFIWDIIKKCEKRFFSRILSKITQTTIPRIKNH